MMSTTVDALIRSGMVGRHVRLAVPDGKDGFRDGPIVTVLAVEPSMRLDDAHGTEGWYALVAYTGGLIGVASLVGAKILETRDLRRWQAEQLPPPAKTEAEED